MTNPHKSLAATAWAGMLALTVPTAQAAWTLNMTPVSTHCARPRGSLCRFPVEM